MEEDNSTLEGGKLRDQNGSGEDVVENLPEIQVRWFSTFPASHEGLPTF